MDHFHRRSASNPTTTFSLLETPPVSIRSSIPNMSLSTNNSSTTQQQSQMSTFGQHQLTVQQPPPPPPPSASSQKPAHANTFVHKLYNMVVDSQYQHLIAWNYTGSSFIVCNIMEFSRDVLPKHFKHNNFSSFVRQLNMYGFHKVNKSPRGHRTLAENQIWEFSHPKFLRNRADLLDDIKRKAMESSDTARRETGDLHAHMTMMQVAQSDMMQQIGHLFENINQLVKELAETRRKQASQQQLMKNMANYISQHNGGQLPSELNIDHFDMNTSTTTSNTTTTTTTTSGISSSKQERPPSIFITSPDPSTANGPHSGSGTSDLINDVFGSRSPLSVQTHNLHHNQHQHQQTRPDLAPPHSSTSRTNTTMASLGPFGNHLPPSPGPSSLISDDESSSLYSPHSPHTPHHHHHQQQQHQQQQHHQHQHQTSQSQHTGTTNVHHHHHHTRLSDTLDSPTPQPTNQQQSNASFAFVNSLDPLSHR
ncbi:hypothetical protein INT45_010946 [Circinella minor]|uniref:HSF-type DNA-binding domain-containing protein n=1 Tax=Circinella minor TaxID=1195481 RepID=A0A8H7VFE1_9FUNG|nr:hypothetical protein INT45_010946 [Circinella minor]